MTKFVWDEGKAAENLEKHGVSFETAKLVFEDQYLLLRPDYFPDEERIQAIGFAESTRLLLVIHTETYAAQDRSLVRIISARPASRFEASLYWRELAHWL